jgi:hypothetical protein
MDRDVAAAELLETPAALRRGIDDTDELRAARPRVVQQAGEVLIAIPGDAGQRDAYG